MTKKIVLIVLGAVALVIALPLLAIGVSLLIIGGHSGNLRSGYHQVSTSSVALVADPVKVRGSGNGALRVKGTSLEISGRDSVRPLFFGVGPASEVTAYLAGTGYDTVSRVEFSPFRVGTSHVAGTGQPGAPADQSFWVAQGVGTAPRLSWKVSGGDYLLVAMNADASPGVAFNVRVGITSAVFFDVALGFTIAGVVLALVGFALLTWGITTKRGPPAPMVAYPPGGQH